MLLAVMAADLLIFAYGMDGGQAVLYVALHLVLLGAAIWQVLALRQLQQGGEKLAEGDFSHPVTLSRGALPELKRHDVHLHWVKGHAENEKNNRCDQLAVAESKKFR